MKLTKYSIMGLGVDKDIKTRREYIQSLIGRFGSDQINREELVPDLLEEFNKLYIIIKTLNFELSLLKDR
jgi:hypothetical protein